MDVNFYIKINKSITVAPYWSTELQGRQVAGVEGQSAVLSCNIESNVAITYQWTFDGNFLPGKTDRTLHIVVVTQDNFGMYKCIVFHTINNQTHQSEFPITLVPRGGPDPPSALEVTHITSVSADIHWTAGFDGGYQDAWFEVAYKLGSEADFGGWEKVDGVPAGQSVTYRISSLSEESEYLVSVKCLNSHGGRSETSPIETVFTTKSKLSSIAITQLYIIILLRVLCYNSTQKSYSTTILQLKFCLTIYYFPATPIIDILWRAITKRTVSIQWVLVQGDVSRVALGHRTGANNRREKRETVDGFVIILDNIHPDNTDIIAQGTFDLSVDNEFMLFTYELNQTEPTGDSDSGRILFEAEGKINFYHKYMGQNI